MIHNVLSKMWGVCIMASIWEEYGDSSQKGNIVFVRKGDHKVELVSRAVDFCKLFWLVTCLVVCNRGGHESLCERNGHQFLEVKKSKTVSIERKLMIE